MSVLTEGTSTAITALTRGAVSMSFSQEWREVSQVGDHSLHGGYYQCESISLAPSRVLNAKQRKKLAKKLEKVLPKWVDGADVVDELSTFGVYAPPCEALLSIDMEVVGDHDGYALNIATTHRAGGSTQKAGIQIDQFPVYNRSAKPRQLVVSCPYVNDVSGAQYLGACRATKRPGE